MPGLLMRLCDFDFKDERHQYFDGYQRHILFHENFHIELSLMSIGVICSSANDAA
jgi:hypothetical protein